ncbi:hypothetical protein VAE151_630949 [Vibrio aestuarianus]|nr:hypothetical protein VAE151_630949 [Vibrio aestuarianus]CAH8241395.1 hypothetical protein VAEKB19_5620001 [Vibrio aestuarianus]
MQTSPIADSRNTQIEQGAEEKRAISDIGIEKVSKNYADSADKCKIPREMVGFNINILGSLYGVFIF